MADIFLHLNGEQKGPFAPKELYAMLEARQIAPDTLAWHEGLSEWSKVSAVLGPLPPPVPVLPPAPPPHPSRPTFVAQKESSSWLVLLIVGAALLFIVPCLAGIALGPITNGIKKAKEAMSLQQSRAIGLAMLAYANDHNGNYPDAPDAPAAGAVFSLGNSSLGATTSTEVFQKLIDGKYVADPSIFYFDMPGKVRPVGNRLASNNVCYDVTSGLTANSPSGIPLVYPTGYSVSFGEDILVTHDVLAPYADFIAFYTGGVARELVVAEGSSIHLKPLDNSSTSSLRQLKP